MWSEVKKNYYVYLRFLTYEMKACSPWLLMKFSDNCSKEIQFTTVNRTTKIHAYTFKKLHAWLKAAHSFMSEGVLFHLHAIRSESSWGHAEELVSITSMIKQRVKTDSLLQKPQIKHGCGYSVDRCSHEMSLVTLTHLRIAFTRSWLWATLVNSTIYSKRRTF